MKSLQENVIKTTQASKFEPGSNLSSNLDWG